MDDALRGVGATTPYEPEATLCRFYTQRTAESSGGQITSVNSLPDFVVTSAKQVYAVFFLNRQNTLFDVGRSMFDVRRSSVSFQIRLAVFLARGHARLKLHSIRQDLQD